MGEALAYEWSDADRELVAHRIDTRFNRIDRGGGRAAARTATRYRRSFELLAKEWLL